MLRRSAVSSFIFEFENTWRVTVVREDQAPQTFCCHDEASARRFAALFDRPDRGPLVAAAPREEVPSLVERLSARMGALASMLVEQLKRRPIRQQQRPMALGVQRRFVIPAIAECAEA